MLYVEYTDETTAVNSLACVESYAFQYGVVPSVLRFLRLILIIDSQAKTAPTPKAPPPTAQALSSFLGW